MRLLVIHGNTFYSDDDSVFLLPGGMATENPCVVPDSVKGYVPMDEMSKQLPYPSVPQSRNLARPMAVVVKGLPRMAITVGKIHIAFMLASNRS